MKKIIFIFLIFISVNKLSAQSLIWNNLSHPDMREVYGVAFSADGTKVLSGSECTETRLRMWDVPTGSMLWEYQLSSTLMCTAGVKFSSNGNWLAALEELGYLLMFDLTSGTPTLAYTVYTGTVGAFSVDFSPAGDKVVTGCTNNKMIIYDVASGTQLNNVTAHTGYVFSVSWSHNGQYIVSGGQDNTIKLWDSAGILISTLSGHTGDVYDVKFSMNDDFIISGSQDNTIKIWDRASGLLVHTITGHANDVRSIAVSPDGNYILSGSTDATSRIWDFNTHNQVASFNQSGAGNIYTVAWSPTENKVVTGAQNNMVLLWDIGSLVGVNEISTVSKAAISPNPSRDMITISTNGSDREEYYFEIISSSGKIMKSGELLNQNSIDISELPAAVYSIRLTGTATTARGYFVKVN